MTTYASIQPDISGAYLSETDCGHAHITPADALYCAIRRLRTSTPCAEPLMAVARIADIYRRFTDTEAQAAAATVSITTITTDDGQDPRGLTYAREYYSPDHLAMLESDRAGIAAAIALHLPVCPLCVAVRLDDGGHIRRDGDVWAEYPADVQLTGHTSPYAVCYDCYIATFYYDDPPVDRRPIIYTRTLRSDEYDAVIDIEGRAATIAAMR